MKKIFLVTIILFSAVIVSAQTLRGTTPPKSDNNNDPLVNGIPYSQYKAQQEALKNKPQMASPSSTTPVLKPVKVTVDAPATAPALTAQPAEKPRGN